MVNVATGGGGERLGGHAGSGGGGEGGGNGGDEGGGDGGGEGGGLGAGITLEERTGAAARAIPPAAAPPIASDRDAMVSGRPNSTTAACCSCSGVVEGSRTSETTATLAGVAVRVTSVGATPGKSAATAAAKAAASKASIDPATVYPTVMMGA